MTEESGPALPKARAERLERRRARQAERRRREIKKRVRRPWLIFRKLIKRHVYEEAARASAGLDDFGDRYYGTGLDRLLESLREADLTFCGRMMTQRAIVGALRQRLLIEDLRKRDPQFFETPLLPPLVVTGLPRTGTTLLHRLLAQDPASRAPMLEELIAPIRSRKTLTRHIDRARLSAELFTLRALTSNLDAMHVSRATAPEECMFALAPTFRSMLFWTLSPSYSYVEWYSQASRRKKYRDYRDILRVLQAQASSRRLVLKAPDHLGGVGELLKTVPEALVIVCHRDPAQAIASFNSLIYALHQTASSMADPRKVGDTNLLYLERESLRYADARKSWAHRIVEIDYDELTRDPLAAVARIYKRAGLEIAPDLDRRFRAFVTANPKDKFGRHRYAAADFGHSEGEIAERFSHCGMAL